MLIIYSHPNKDGHCGYVLKRVKKELNRRNISYSLIDLYAEDYDPVMKPEEHYTSGHYEIGEDTKKYRNILKNNDKFFIIYPTWWNGTPAMLKGFFDRTLTSRFAYKYENGVPKGLLSGKAAVITTTGGPFWAELLLLGNRSLKTVTKDTLRFCGIKSKGYLIGSSRELTDKQKGKIEAKVPKAIDFLVK